MIEIRWSKKYRPAKADNGHSVRQYGWGPYRNGFMSRSYVRCECGTRLSGQGESGGLDSHRKHVKREAVKRATPNPWVNSGERTESGHIIYELKG